MQTSSSIDDLTRLTLADGIKTTADGKPLVYRQVHLRETTVADERAAVRMAERVVPVNGLPQLLVSEADFKYAMTLRHIDALECDGIKLAGALIDMDLFGRLSSHDLGLIEQRVFLLTLAAELRYGNITQAQFDSMVGGKEPPPAAAAPQPVGQGAAVGAQHPDAGPGPALLADYAGGAAAGAPAQHGR